MFVLGLYFTFPWDAAKDRILDMASKGSGMAITAQEIKPSWLTGVNAIGVTITPAGSKDPLTFDKITARAKILGLLTGKRGAKVSLPIAKGNVDADFSVDEETIELKADTESIELGLIPGLVEAVGLPLTGTIDIDTDMVIGQKDPKLTNGTLSLKAKQLRIEKGGKIAGFPVPELSIGDADWQIPIEEGKASLKSLKVAGESVDLVIDGTINILSPPSKSTVNLTISFKPTEKLLASDPLLGALLNNIQKAKGSDGFYTYAMAGSIKSPRFTARKK
jgi:type II secretion system protein N